MTKIVTTIRTAHHHLNGSIDFDFYSGRATALRGQAKRDASTLKAACAFVLTMFGAIAVAVLIAEAPLQAPNSYAAVPQSKSTPTR